MANDKERYLVEHNRGDGNTEWGSVTAETLAAARRVARKMREDHNIMGTVVTIGVPDGDAVEHWTRVRKSKIHPTGWKHEVG